MLPIAMYFLKLGIATIPIYYKSKIPAIKSWIEFQSQLPTEQQLSNWFSHKFRNIAIITGWQNLTVLDFDNFDTYYEWFNWATEGQSALVAQYSLCAVTKRGVHIYIKTKAPNMKLQGLDIKSNGGYVIAPPSIHPSGAQYCFVNDQAPIVRVSSIEAILPADWLQQSHTEQPLFQNNAPLDPWELAASRQCGRFGLIAEIRQRVSILDLLPQAVKSSRQGWYKTLCPFHSDNQYSFWIDDNRGLCNCYSCNFKIMDVINLASRLYGVGNREAILMLGERI